jgi:hypothetical protein
MNRKIVGRLLLLVVALAVVAAVGVAAYNWGVSAGQGHVAVGPFNGRGPGFGMGRGMGWQIGTIGSGWGFLGFLGLLLLGLLLVWIVVAAVSSPRGASDVGGAAAVDQLRELSDMHTNGKLTDAEFEAAKRKLLGL